MQHPFEADEGSDEAKQSKVVELLGVEGQRL